MYGLIVLISILCYFTIYSQSTRRCSKDEIKVEQIFSKCNQNNRTNCKLHYYNV